MKKTQSEILESMKSKVERIEDAVNGDNEYTPKELRRMGSEVHDSVLEWDKLFRV